MVKLSPAQERFSQEYIIKKGNAAEAYRIAYPRSQKWKDNSVYCAASKMLSNAKVSQRIKELQEELKNKFDITEERLLKEQATIAFFDFRRCFHESGRLLDPKEFPDDVAAAISSIKVSKVKVIGSGDDAETETITELKIWNKNTALDSLFKNKGLYDRDNTQKRPMVIIKDFSGGHNEQPDN